MNTILVVDDKEMMRDSVSATLTRAGFHVETADDGPGALEQAARRRPDCVVSDLKMPGMTGLELLEKLRAIDDEVPFVLMTAFGAIDTAVRAIKLGAFDYITKPFEGDSLIIAVKRALEHARLTRENAVLRVEAEDGARARSIPGPLPSAPGRASPGVRTGLGRLIGESPAMKRVKEQVAAVAESAGTVLVVGESGAGKEVVARAIHESGPRRAAPFLAVNCAALPEALLESELFGHERGAFTGAERTRKGRFELADGGTLLLDEVSEIPPHLQAKLLRVLQERHFERVGSSVSIGVDVRVIATSNRDLPRAVAERQFRQDLFFRLNVLPIHLPPLRDRLEDVPSMAEHFIAGICRREGRERVTVETGAFELLLGYAWPGNVRELQNICERAVVLSAASAGSRDAVITRELIQPWLSTAPASAGPAAPAPASGVAPVAELKPLPLNMTLDEIEREAIVQTLQRYHGHRQKTAKALGIGVRTLGLKLKKWKEEHLVAETL